MPLRINPAEIKTVARLTSQIKEIGPAARRSCYWNGVHRLVATNNQLRLLTTDTKTFLDWSIPVKEGQAEQDFDVIIPAEQFNSLAGCSSERTPYELEYSAASGLLTLTQEHRILRLRIDSDAEYPLPASFVERSERSTETASGMLEPPTPSWSTKAEVLATELAFMAPFIDAENPHSGRSVATWNHDGDLEGGSFKKIAMIHGLPSPPVPMSFKQRTAKAVAAFLAQLGGDVEIQVKGPCYVFTCPTSHQKLIVSGEDATFPNPTRRLEGIAHEALHVDLKSLASSVSILSAVMPTGADRLEVRLRGRGENSVVQLSTPGDAAMNSKDEFAIIREFISTSGDEDNESPPAETQFAMNIQRLGETLKEMKRTTLAVSFYGRKKLIRLEEMRTADDQTVRSVLLTCNSLTPPDMDESLTSVLTPNDPTPPAPEGIVGLPALISAT